MVECTLETLEARYQTLVEKEADLRSRGLDKEADALAKSTKEFESKLRLLQLQRIEFEKQSREAAQRSNKLVDKIGLTNLSDEQFKLLSPQQAYDHMIGLSRGPIDAAHLKQRRLAAEAMSQWSEFGVDPETSSPYSYAAGKSFRRRGSVEHAARAADARMAEDGFTITSVANGDTLEYWLLDGTGKRVRIDNTWHGIHMADELYRQTRLKADNLTPPGMPDIKTRLTPGEIQFDPTSREPGMLQEPDPLRSTVSPNARIAFGSFKRFWLKHAGVGRELMDAIGREYLRVTGKPWPLTGMWHETFAAGSKVENAKNQVQITQERLARKFSVPWDTRTMVRIGAFEEQRDWNIQRIRNQTWEEFSTEFGSGQMSEADVKKIANERVRAAEKQINADAKAAHNLSDNEVAFSLAREKEIIHSIMRDAGIPEDDIMLGWIWRTRDLQFADKKQGLLRRDSPLYKDNSIEKLFEQDAEVRAKQGTDEQALFIDPILSPLANSKYANLREIARAGNSADRVHAFAQNVYRRLYMGRIADQFKGQLTEEAGQYLISGVPISPELAQRYIRDIATLEGLPTSNEAVANLGRKETLALRALKWADRTERLQDKAPQFVIDAMTRYYEKLGMRAAQSYVPSLMDTWIKLYRGQTFGLNIIKAARDVVTNDFLLGVRLPKEAFWQAWKETKVPSRTLVNEYLRQKNLGWLPDLIQNASQIELNSYFESKPHMRGIIEALGRGEMPKDLSGLVSPTYWADVFQFFFKVGDIGSRMTANRASELATRSAWARLKNATGDLDYAMDKFLTDTGVAYSFPDTVANVRMKLEQSMRSGDLHSIIDAVRTANEADVIGVFRRWNSSPFMDSAPGRLAGQFFSWNRNFMISMINDVTGPARNLKTSRARAEAYSAMSIKWAIGAEALYALGGALNLDTSSWIPFLNNFQPPNGPFMTTVQNARAIWGGNDPQLRRRIESSPAAAGAVALLFARQALPFMAGPDVLRRTTGQLFGPQTIPDWARKFLTLPPQQRDTWNQFVASIGGDPLNSPLYPRFRVGGIPAILFGHTAGVLQDAISKSTGAVPPGTYEELARWTPLIGSQGGVNQ